MTAQLTLDQLLERRAANPRLVLVEALPEKYFRSGHLPAARHLPHDRVADLAATVLPDLAAEIVVYCASKTCQNSHIAARELTKRGYTNVAVFAGGKEEWVNAGLQTVSEAVAA